MTLAGCLCLLRAGRSSLGRGEYGLTTWPRSRMPPRESLMGPDAAKEEIRERADLVEIISQYVELKQAGRNWKGLCPFHQEKTPSFNVNRESKFWKCFGCGAGGDVFSFVQRAENLAFPEAMKLLADKLGIDWDPDPKFAAAKDEREEILHANALAMGWFREQLRSPAGTAARAYLESRGLDEATIERFNVGCAPAAWDSLLKQLASRGVGEERALRAGLARRSERGSVYDVFRNRVIFPISDVVGRIIGFGGRALDPEDPAKYLNSPETPVFRKGRTFYGLDVARRAIADEGHVVVVEGYMDVVALAQHGIEHCVATLGTALTEDHAKILSRYTPEIALVYDDDEAGMQATLRSAQVFEEVAAAVKVAPLRGGRDPDDYVREFGAEAFRELLQERIGLVEYRLKTIFDAHRDGGAEGRTQAAQEAADVLGGVRDLARRQALVAWAADAWAGPDVGRAGRLEEALVREMQRRAEKSDPTQRNEWGRVLANLGVRSGGGRGAGRRLPRSEWLERERRREDTLSAINIARWSGHPPNSPLSPLSADFIGDTLASRSSPLVRNAQKRERMMLTAMLERPGVAAMVFGMLRPDEMLLASHRDIALQIAEARDEDGVPKLAEVVERLSSDEELLATAVDLAVAEYAYETESVEGEERTRLVREAIEADVRLIREAKLLRGEGVPLYKAERLYNADSQRLEGQDNAESLADLEERVRAGLADGSIDTKSELYQRYMEIRRKLSGIGELPMWEFG